MKVKYLVQENKFLGLGPRNAYGKRARKRSGWKTVVRCETLEEARDQRRKRGGTGLSKWRVTLRGEVVIDERGGVTPQARS